MALLRYKKVESFASSVFFFSISSPSDVSRDLSTEHFKCSSGNRVHGGLIMRHLMKHSMDQFAFISSDL